jgi:hypothetical protein
MAVQQCVSLTATALFLAGAQALEATPVLVRRSSLASAALRGYAAGSA